MLYHSANSDFFHISFVNYCFLNHTFYYQDGFEMKFSTSSTYSTNEITSVMCSWNHLRFSPLYRLHLYDECYLEIYHCWTKQFLYIFFYFLQMIFPHSHLLQIGNLNFSFLWWSLTNLSGHSSHWMIYQF